MARIRSVKPEICESETMARLPAEVERTFVRLWTHLDDHGRCKDDPRLIKAALFPLHDDVTVEDVDAHLWALTAEGLIVRYEVDGKRFVACPSWGEHQHPQKPRPSKFPAPDDPAATAVREPSRTPTGTVADAYGPVVEGSGGGEVAVVGEVHPDDPSENHSDSAPTPAPGAVAVDEQMVNRALLAYSRIVTDRTPGVLSYDAFAAGVRRDAIAEGIPDDLRVLLIAGHDVDSAAAERAGRTDVDGPRNVPAAESTHPLLRPVPTFCGGCEDGWLFTDGNDVARCPKCNPNPIGAAS